MHLFQSGFYSLDETCSFLLHSACYLFIIFNILCAKHFKELKYNNITLTGFFSQLNILFEILFWYNKMNIFLSLWRYIVYTGLSVCFAGLPKKILF